MPKLHRYWVRIGERNFGPFTADEVRRRTDVGPETQLCPEGAKGGSEWRPLREVPEFAESRAEGEPAPPDMSVESRRRSTGDFIQKWKAGQQVPEPQPGRMWDLLKLVATAILLLVAYVVMTERPGLEPPQYTPAPARTARAIPKIEYDNKWTRQAVECTDFRWGQYGDLYFNVRLKSGRNNFTEGGMLRFEAYDAQGVVVFSGVVGDYSSGLNTKVFEGSISLSQEKMDRVVRVVFL